MNCDYAEVSVKNNVGISELFERVIDKCLDLQDLVNKDGVNPQTFKLDSIEGIKPMEFKAQKKKKSKCC